MERKVYYSLNIRDEEGNPIAPHMLTDNQLIDVSDRIANSSWAGSITLEEDEDTDNQR